jgi:fatty-acid desaturase
LAIYNLQWKRRTAKSMEKTIKRIIKTTIVLPQLWAAIIPMHMIGFYAIYEIFTGQSPEWWWLAVIAGYVLLTMVGIAAGYHRLFCHKSFEVNKVIKRIILWLGVMAGQGSTITWCSIHRGYHHRHPDTEKDLHSPKDGFWHSYILWMFKYPKISIRSTIDLQKDSDHRVVHKYYIPILWISHAIMALINFDIWLYLFALPALITLHSFLVQTSLTHYKIMGYRNYNTKDNSVNSIWLFPILLGEAWHNNHHGEGRNPNLGGRHWWEVDPTYWIINLIRKDEIKNQ